MRATLFVILVLIAFRNAANAGAISAVTSGNWAAKSTWSCNCQPGNSDNITIPSGITVTSSAPVILSLGPVMAIMIDGTLVMNNNSMYLDAGDVVAIGTGGRITGSGHSGGIIYSGLIPVFIGAPVNGPASISTGVLPSTLMFFKGEPRQKDVLITWASATGLDYDSYSLQRSADGVHFELLAEVSGGNDAAARLDCSFVDVHPLRGYTYYRLQGVNRNGTVATVTIALALDKQHKITF